MVLRTTTTHENKLEKEKRPGLKTGHYTFPAFATAHGLRFELKNGLYFGNIRPSSTLDHIQRQPTQRSLLIPRLHIHPGLIHRLDHLIQRNFMLAPLAQS